MTEHLAADYLGGLSAAQRRALVQVNSPGLAALRRYLASGEAAAFLGAGASAPLYPPRDGLIGELVDAAAGRLDEREAASFRALAQQSPEEVVEVVRASPGAQWYREVLRTRVDPETGKSWTAVQELVCRCAFKAVVTTNYDLGIVHARMRVRPGTSATGFITWEDAPGLDRWLTGEAFGQSELPVLFAHGQLNQPRSIVLSAQDRRHAYAGKLSQVLARLMDGHLVWIGFSFADQQITTILQEIANRTGAQVDLGAAPRHVAVMAWDPEAEGNDPQILAQRAEIEYGALLVLYPAPGGDHSALAKLLARLTDERFPPASDLPAHTGLGVAVPDPLAIAGAPTVPVKWVPPVERVEHFTGRAEELARLDRWAADPQVAMVGVTAWGGSGKTTLVTHWVLEAGGLNRRPGVRGVFGWSFYADPSVEHWADNLLEWTRQEFGIEVPGSIRAEAVLQLLRLVPLLLVLDGLEIVQEDPAEDGFGRLLDDTLREVLAGVCQQRPPGLVVLTSRFPFADLEAFDGGSARMLDLPPINSADGSALLARAGGSWLPDTDRRALVQAVDGHALAIGALAGLLAGRPPASGLVALPAELAAAARTDARVGRMLDFYARRLNEPDRYLLGAVSLFARPVPATAVLAVTKHDVFADRLAGWTPAMVEEAARNRLAGLATWHTDRTISAHPLIRDTFRPLVMDAAATRHQVRFRLPDVGSFTGRASLLAQLDAALGQGRAAVITQAISGLGGLGKTRLAALYAQARHDEFEIAAWVRAGPYRIADLAEFAVAVGLPEGGRTQPELADDAVKFLSNTHRRWLLVLENAPGPEKLGWLPSSDNGRVLLTSQFQGETDAFGAETPIRVLDPAAESDKFHADVGGSRGVQIGDDDTQHSIFGFGPPGEIIETGGDRPGPRRRYLKGQCPESIPVGEPFSLLVSIVLAGPPGSRLKLFGVPAEGQDVLLVVHAPGLRLLGHQRLTVRVPPDEDSEPVMFELRADAPGPRPVSVTAWIGGSYLGELLVEITAERDHPPGPHRDVLAEIVTEPAEGAVSLVVRFDPAQNAYRFEFRDEDNPDEVTSNLAYDPGPLVEHLIGELDDLVKGRTGYSPAQARDYLVNEGARLWSQLVPAQLRQQFWDRQDRIRQLTIVADKDAVPWELLYPLDPGHDAGFLVDQFPVTRAIFRWRPARMLNLWPTRFVLPEGSLPGAEDEIDAMRQLLDPGQPPGQVISALTPLQELITNGNFGLLHFACHNTYNPRDGSSITLDNVQFTPTLMTTAAINRVLAHAAPTVFMNACRSAGLNVAYNRLDGWANKFLEAGAAAFIGSMWAVSDGVAREFAQEFYIQLQAGFSLGEAVMRARQATASQRDDPTWLAYTVYGHPRATISQRLP